MERVSKVKLKKKKMEEVNKVSPSNGCHRFYPSFLAHDVLVSPVFK